MQFGSSIQGFDDMSHTNFDANSFGHTAGFAVFGALASAAAAARDRARHHADVIATDQALATWEDLVAGLERDIEYLRGVNGELAAALRERDDEALLLRSQVATLRQRLAYLGDSVE